MNPGPYNEKLRQFAAAHLQGLNIRVQEHGRVELTPTMAFVEAMVAVPLDVNGEPWCTEEKQDFSWFKGSVDKELLKKLPKKPPKKRRKK